MLGGTFDPIHHAHLRLALELRDQFDFDQVRLIPCALPAHRESPNCTAQQRLKMVELGLGHEPGLCVDDRELRASGPSYSIDTLLSLRQELGNQVSLTMVMGSDSFLSLDHWHRWRELLDHCHILVAVRPGWHLAEGHPMTHWAREHQADAVAQLHQAANGKVLFAQMAELNISATAIRKLIASHQSPRFLLPDSVWQHIQAHRLYL